MKKSEVENIKTLDRNQIFPVKTGYRAKMVHLVVEEGTAQVTGPYGMNTIGRVLVTGCNRALEEWHSQSKYDLFGYHGTETPDLCSLCVKRTGMTKEALLANLELKDTLNKLESDGRMAEWNAGVMWHQIGDWIGEQALEELRGMDTVLLVAEDLIAILNKDEVEIIEQAEKWEQFHRISDI